jgi:hypothetical protein
MTTPAPNVADRLRFETFLAPAVAGASPPSGLRGDLRSYRLPQQDGLKSPDATAAPDRFVASERAVRPREDIPTSVSDVAGEDLTGRFHTTISLSWSPCWKSRSRTNPESDRAIEVIRRSKIHRSLWELS